MRNSGISTATVAFGYTAMGLGSMVVCCVVLVGALGIAWGFGAVMAYERVAIGVFGALVIVHVMIVGVCVGCHLQPKPSPAALRRRGPYGG